MRARSKLIAAVLGTGLCATTAQAAVILDENFDGYADQTAMNANWTPTLGGALLDTTRFVSEGQSATAPTTNGSSRRIIGETGFVSVNNSIEWSFNFFDSNAAASPYRNYARLQDTATGSTNQLVSMGLNNNQLIGASGGNYYMARIVGYTPPSTDPDGGPNELAGLTSGAYFKLNDFGVGLRSTGWNHLKVIIGTDDGLSTDYAFYVNGLLAELVNNVGTSASLRSLDNVVLGSGLSSTNDVGFDDMLVETVDPAEIPEPASMTLLALGGMALGLRRRRA